MLESQPAVAMRQPTGGGGDWWKGDDKLPAVAARLYPERLLERRSRLMNIALAGLISRAASSVAKLSLLFGETRAHGTGFLVTDSTILTNHHNVIDQYYGNVTSVVAEFDWEEGFEGKRLVRKGLIEGIISAADHDWAVIPLERPVDRATLKLGTPFDVGV